MRRISTYALARLWTNLVGTPLHAAWVNLFILNGMSKGFERGRDSGRANHQSTPIFFERCLASPQNDYNRIILASPSHPLDLYNEFGTSEKVRASFWYSLFANDLQNVYLINSSFVIFVLRRNDYGSCFCKRNQTTEWRHKLKWVIMNVPKRVGGCDSEPEGQKGTIALSLSLSVQSPSTHYTIDLLSNL